jgi:hypothetical protein
MWWMCRPTCRALQTQHAFAFLPKSSLRSDGGISTRRGDESLALRRKVDCCRDLLFIAGPEPARSPPSPEDACEGVNDHPKARSLPRIRQRATYCAEMSATDWVRRQEPAADGSVRRCLSGFKDCRSTAATIGRTHCSPAARRRRPRSPTSALSDDPISTPELRDGLRSAAEVTCGGEGIVQKGAISDAPSASTRQEGAIETSAPGPPSTVIGRPSASARRSAARLSSC